MTINQENLETWLREMETTDKPQAKQTLCAVVEVQPGGDLTYGYCCLGLGSLMVPTIDFVGVSDEDLYEGANGFFDGEANLAPPSFCEWLGVEIRTNADGGQMESDVFIDYPEELRNQPSIDGTGKIEGPLRKVATAAMLNDAGLTFKQIAQTIRYFGLIEMPYTEGLL